MVVDLVVKATLFLVKATLTLKPSLQVFPKRVSFNKAGTSLRARQAFLLFQDCYNHIGTIFYSLVSAIGDTRSRFRHNPLPRLHLIRYTELAPHLHALQNMNRYQRGPLGAGPSKATPSTLCQKCLKKGHYSYECKAIAQERP